MSKTPHSPWTYVYEGSGNHIIHDAQDRVVACVEEGEGFNRDEAADNARLIERACNSHDELVGLCEKAIFGMKNVLDNTHGMDLLTPEQIKFTQVNMHEVLRGRIASLQAITSKITESQCP